MYKMLILQPTQEKVLKFADGQKVKGEIENMFRSSG